MTILANLPGLIGLGAFMAYGIILLASWLEE